MNTQPMNTEQQEAFLDLMTLGMYADGHLALSEDDRLKRILDTSQLPDDYARQQMVDASLRRVTQRVGNAQKREDFFRALPNLFNDHAKKNHIMLALNELVASDGDETRAETTYLRQIKEALNEG